MSAKSLTEIPSLDQKVARELVERGATIFIEGMPVQSQFGLDYVSSNIGAKFKGMKMVNALSLSVPFKLCVFPDTSGHSLCVLFAIS